MQKKKILAISTIILLLVAMAIAVLVMNSGLLATNQNVEPTPSPTPQAPPTDSPTEPTPTPTTKPRSSSHSSSPSSSSSSSSSSTPTATPTPTPTENPSPTATPTATPIPSPSPLPTPAPNDSQVFRDNFESGNMSAWTATDTTDVQLSVENHLLKCQTAYATNQSWGYLYKWLDQNYTSLYWRWYVFFDNLPTTDGNIIGAGGIYNSAVEQDFNPANIVCSLNVVREGGVSVWKFAYNDKGNLNNLTTLKTVQEDTWYLVELKAIQGNGTGEVHFYLNNVEALNATGLVNNNNSGINHVSIGGGITADNPVTWYCGGAIAATQYIGPDPLPSMATSATIPISIPIYLGIAVTGTSSTLFLTQSLIARKIKK
ncbi:MAG TPA: hypothetical protein VLH35_06675 [Candidatus Acidoferrales bacterium]|nr:hypothetical protein [Candidatus Acidoferrales bacterium]